MFWIGLTAVSFIGFLLAIYVLALAWRDHARTHNRNTEHGLVVASVFTLASIALTVTAFTRQYPIGDLNSQSGTFLRGVILLGLIYLVFRHPVASA